jgi:hypothetical protein
MIHHKAEFAELVSNKTHLALSEVKRNVARVENLAILELASVMHLQGIFIFTFADDFDYQCF